SQGAHLSLQVSMHDIGYNKQKFIFKFIDDGFYTEFKEQAIVNSYADVRASGWYNIHRLIALEHETLEHTHTAYAGNIICFSLTCACYNNVISLEEYYNS